MKVDKIDPIVQATSQYTSLPLPLVASIIKHQFSFIKSHILKPHASVPTILLPFLGKIQPSLNSINFQIRRLIPKVRANPELTAQLSALWQLRQLAIKDTTRRDFKKRFGKWHN